MAENFNVTYTDGLGEIDSTHAHEIWMEVHRQGDVRTLHDAFRNHFHTWVELEVTDVSRGLLEQALAEQICA